MTRWDKVPVWIDGVPYWMIDAKGSAVSQKVGPPEDPPVYDPGAPLSEPALDRIATALEGIRRELCLLRAEAAKARPAARLLGPPRRTPPGSPPALPRQS